MKDAVGDDGARPPHDKTPTEDASAAAGAPGAQASSPAAADGQGPVRSQGAGKADGTSAARHAADEATAKEKVIDKDKAGSVGRTTRPAFANARGRVSAASATSSDAAAGKTAPQAKADAGKDTDDGGASVVSGKAPSAPSSHPTTGNAAGPAVGSQSSAIVAPGSGAPASASATTGQNNASGASASSLAGGGAASGSPGGDASSTGSLNAARLARGLQSAVHQKGGTVTLRLTPPDLGTVRIRMQLQGPAVSAELHTDNAQARAMLTHHLGQLREALEGRGLSVQHLNVQAMPASSAAPMHHAQQQAGQQAPDGRSRGFNGRQPGQGGDQGRDHARDQPDGEGRQRRGTFEQMLSQEDA